MKKCLISLVVLLLATSLRAQYDGIMYDNHVYVDYVESVQFQLSNKELSLPFIQLGSRERLTLKFDDREGGFKNYTYHLVHCDKDWNLSPLEELEYIDGFNGEEIDEFSYSTNTYSEYTNYQVNIPNDDIRWTISGNYLLIIYDNDIQVPVLTRRFIVTENVVGVGGQMIKPKNLSNLRTHQELEVIVNMKEFKAFRPQEEITVTVMQNGNTNSAYHNLTSNFTRAEFLYFNDFNQQIVFPALKEFRSCDIRSLKYRSEFVHSIEQNDQKTNVLMDLAVKRADKHFHTEPDANGGYIIENRDLGFGDTSSEYAEVIFTLEVDRPYLKDVYIVGSLCDWQPKEKFRLDWDSQNELYTKTISMKQGYYDYMFATLEEDGMLKMEDIEGSWYETENDYQIIAYYRALGGEYDRVIGFNTMNSNPSN